MATQKIRINDAVVLMAQCRCVARRRFLPSTKGYGHVIASIQPLPVHDLLTTGNAQAAGQDAPGSVLHSAAFSFCLGHG